MSKKKNRKTGGFNRLTSCISTTMVLLLLGTVVFFVAMADNLSRSVRENFTVQVLLDDSTPASEIARLQRKLTTAKYTKQVVYISKEQATREQAEALNADPAEFLGYSPIPASFEVALRADYACNDSLEVYAPELRAEAHVLDVIYPQDLIDNVNRNIRLISLILLGVAALLGIVSVSLINSTISMSIYARRFTIQSMKLVGAKWSFIRRPFLLQAFLIGFLASAIADALLYAGITALMRWDADLQALITQEVIALTLGTVAAAGILLTQLCAFISVNRNLRMSSAEAFRR